MRAAFNIECHKTKTKVTLTSYTDNPVNQSKLKGSTCSRRTARENVCERVTVGFSFQPCYISPPIWGSWLWGNEVNLLRVYFLPTQLTARWGLRGRHCYFKPNFSFLSREIAGSYCNSFYQVMPFLSLFHRLLVF